LPTVQVPLPLRGSGTSCAFQHSVRRGSGPGLGERGAACGRGGAGRGKCGFFKTDPGFFKTDPAPQAHPVFQVKQIALDVGV